LNATLSILPGCNASLPTRSLPLQPTTTVAAQSCLCCRCRSCCRGRSRFSCIVERARLLFLHSCGRRDNCCLGLDGQVAQYGVVDLNACSSSSSVAGRLSISSATSVLCGSSGSGKPSWRRPPVFQTVDVTVLAGHQRAITLNPSAGTCSL